MKWVLIWWISLETYRALALTSGTATFDDFVACNTARIVMSTAFADARRGQSHGGTPTTADIWAQCWPSTSAVAP